MSSGSSHDHTLFAGTHGHVVAVDKATGETKWQQSLPGTGYAVVSIVYEDGKLFVASGGRVFALDPEDGKLLWENPMKGMGMGGVYLTTAQSNDTEAVMTLLEQQQQQNNASSSSAAT